ncbi:4624_t:CDS:2 [Entrophospora sp. SA101]|nr:7123_t:CDS:2 [Entrophospora sp. SA101]CAJ0865724.1 15443_t:CDS:2 [Entrophospora sp. SA101]CAJ0889969.1 8260_t:CDS:2 [Entrophospora sp. SA101]CAJ0890034.1 8266_t:CDS:2 [Entrophospora sp. SA101]CAJ0903579.1 4624_t:CDS:2 [Entrophospora sp. SA101]
MQKLLDSQRLKEAVKDSSIFAASVYGRILELSIQHRFQNAALAGYPVILSFSEPGTGGESTKNDNVTAVDSNHEPKWSK